MIDHAVYTRLDSRLTGNVPEALALHGAQAECPVTTPLPAKCLSVSNLALQPKLLHRRQLLGKKEGGLRQSLLM